jgi:hypothetical protein
MADTIITPTLYASYTDLITTVEVSSAGSYYVIVQNYSGESTVSNPTVLVTSATPYEAPVSKNWSISGTTDLFTYNGFIATVDTSAANYELIVENSTGGYDSQVKTLVVSSSSGRSRIYNPGETASTESSSVNLATLSDASTLYGYDSFDITVTKSGSISADYVLEVYNNTGLGWTASSSGSPSVETSASLINVAIVLLAPSGVGMSQTVYINDRIADLTFDLYSPDVSDVAITTSSCISIICYDVSIYYQDEARPIKNDRLINLTGYMPSAFYDSDVFEFMKIFEDHWNYDTYLHYIENSQPVSVLKKIELLATKRDPDLIDKIFLNDLAKNQGYNINFNKDTLVALVGASDDTDTNRYLRHTIRELPAWYSNKTTDYSLTSIMFMFGIVSEVYTMWTNDYNTNWETEAPTYEEGEDAPAVIPAGYYPTPHFWISIDTTLTPTGWETNIEKIRDFIDSIRPVNTVFEGFAVKVDADNDVPVLVPYSAISVEYMMEVLSTPIRP